MRPVAPEKVKHRAAELRQDMTPAEKRLWSALRNGQLQGIKFRRSHPIGRFVADFCAPSCKLVVELDGSVHLGQQDADAARSQWLEENGYCVLRFWNSRVIDDLPGVLAEIGKAIQAQS